MATRASVVLGQVYQLSPKYNVVKVWVNRLVLDKWLMHHFPKRESVIAYDEDKNIQVGDVVLLRRLENPRHTNIRHDVEKIIYQTGNVIDPVTGRNCDANGYWDEKQRTDLLERDPVERNIALTETLREKKGVYHDQRMSNPLMSLNKKEWDEIDKKPAFADPPGPPKIPKITIS